MGYVPYHEGITGSDLSGSSPATNRTYTLTNDDAVLAQMQVIIENTILQANIDFTLNTETNTILFINNVWDHQNISLDYFVDDNTSTDVYLSSSITCSGSDFSGSDLEINRIFQFINNKTVVSEQMQVVVANVPLQINIDYTFDSRTQAITFLNPISNSSNISIDYLYIGTSYYCTTKQLVDYSGLGVQITLENLGTGNGTNKSFNSVLNNIIDTSYTIYYGVEDSNNLNKMIENVDYQIELDEGRILLFESGVTKLSTKELYLSYTYSPKHSDSILTNFLPKAQKEVDLATGNYWGAVKSSVQYFDGYDSGYPHTEEPYGTQTVEQPEFELDFTSIQSITSINFLDFSGATTDSINSDYIRFFEDGRVLVGATNIPNGKANIEITFTHGYTETLDLIQELTALHGAVIGLKNISGGSYKDISTFTVGRKSYSIGQIYVNVRESISQMEKKIDHIMEKLGYNYGIA